MECFRRKRKKTDSGRKLSSGAATCSPFTYGVTISTYFDKKISGLRRHSLLYFPLWQIGLITASLTLYVHHNRIAITSSQPLGDVLA